MQLLPAPSKGRILHVPREPIPQDRGVAGLWGLEDVSWLVELELVNACFSSEYNPRCAP